MNFIWKYFSNYHFRAIMAPLLKLSEVVLELFVPLIVAGIIDKGIANADQNYIIGQSIILIVLALAGVCVAVLAQYFAAGAAVGFAANLRADLYTHIMGFSYRAQDRLGKEKLITRLTADILEVQNTVNMTLRLFLRSPVVVVGAVLMAFTVDVRCAWIFAAVVLLLSIVIFILMRLVIPAFSKVQGSLDQVVSDVRSDVEGARVIRAFSLEERATEEFSKDNGILYRAQLRSSRIAAFQNPLTLVLINLATILLIDRGAIRVNVGALSQGQVVALVNYMSQILTELIKFANAVLLLSQGIASGKRIKEVLDAPLEAVKAGDESRNGEIVGMSAGAFGVPAKTRTDGAVPTNTPLVRLSGVSMRYHAGAKEALSDIDLEVYPGEMIGVIGSTGSGKTTLVNVAAGFYEAERGETYRRGTFAIAPQKSVLFTGTIGDNLRWAAPDATDEALYEALRVAVAREIVRDAGGLDAPVARGGSNFSGGQRQRLAVARAVAAGADLLILDDSASALDYKTERMLREGLSTIPRHPAVLWVSQRISSIREADRIYVLENGRIAGCGTHEELLESCSAYREIYESQV